jgi:hypothetical protein
MVRSGIAAVVLSSAVPAWAGEPAAPRGGDDLAWAEVAPPPFVPYVLPRPLVHLDADDERAVLELRVSDAASGHVSWEPVCRAPCDVRVEPDAQYRISGPGLASTGTFVLPATFRSVELAATMRSANRPTIGLVLLGLGLVPLVAGVVSFAELDASQRRSLCADCTDPSAGEAVLGVFGVLGIAGGLALFSAGTWMLARTKSSARVFFGGETRTGLRWTPRGPALLF